MADVATETGTRFDRLIEQYERLLDDGTRESRYSATLAVLDALTTYCNSGGLAERGFPTYLREHWYTRLASALSRFATLPTTAFTISELEEICRRKQTIAYIFAASGYRNTRHLIEMLSQPSETQGREMPTAKATIAFALCGLDDIPVPMMDLLPMQPPRLLLILMLGWLNQRAILTQRGEDNRTRLLALGELIEKVEISDRAIPLIVNAWMYTTYASEPTKHQLKRAFNSLLKTLLAKRPMGDAERPKQRHSKPLMVVIHERFTSPHAMYRCYAPMIKSLGRYFELMAVVEEEHIDDAAAEMFSRVIKIPKKRKNVWQIKSEIDRLAPDVVYYPSLGMSHWTVMLAQLRLAPMQFMTLGHPATSMSDVIDYVYTCEMEGDLSAVFNEKVLVGAETADFQPHSDLPDVLPDLLPASDREVRIAVNSKVMKLSHRLVDICVRLSKNASVPVRFSFFPGERHLYFDGLVPAIKARLPEAHVHPYVSYDQFLKEMCKCDLALAAFPFGNTNSTVDTCLLGIPTVVHFGPESPAQSDAVVLRTIGLPDDLVCRSDEEYYETALRLINDPEARVNALGGLSRETVRQRFYESEDSGSDCVFADMIYSAFKNHGHLMASDQRVFRHSDLLALQ
jgi:hypothetical protein